MEWNNMRWVEIYFGIVLVLFSDILLLAEKDDLLCFIRILIRQWGIMRCRWQTKPHEQHVLRLCRTMKSFPENRYIKLC